MLGALALTKVSVPGRCEPIFKIDRRNVDHIIEIRVLKVVRPSCGCHVLPDPNLFCVIMRKSG